MPCFQVPRFSADVKLFFPAFLSHVAAWGAPTPEDCQYKNPLPAMPVQRLLDAGAGQAAITRTGLMDICKKPIGNDRRIHGNTMISRFEGKLWRPPKLDG